MLSTQTINYYNQNATNYIQSTADVNFREIQDLFLALLPSQGTILDFGCGSGRDARYFLDKGFCVDATDGSAQLCRMASELTGIEVKQMLFSELKSECAYDGIWACSSILHLPKTELKDVFGRMIRALKPGGYIYTSFKYGEFEGYRKERFFTDFTEETFEEFLRDIPGIKIKEHWISTDVRPGREDEKWLNLILQQSDTV